jgi:hypothetical protein
MEQKLEDALRETINALIDYGNVMGDMSCTDDMTSPNKPKAFLRRLREELRTAAPDEPFSNVMARLEKLAESVMGD